MASNYKRKDILQVPIEDIVIGENHSRPYGHSSDGLKMLVDDIREHGQLQPGTCRRNSEGQLELISGFGRFEAVKTINQGLGKDEEPLLFMTVITRCNESEAVMQNVRENVKRTNISPIEEAMTMKKLMDAYGKTQEDLTEVFGKSTAWVSTRLSLLNLSDIARKQVHDGDITVTQALKLAKVPEAKQAMAMAKMEAAKMQTGSTRERTQAVNNAAGVQDKLTIPKVVKEAREFQEAAGVSEQEKALMDAVVAMCEGAGVAALLDWMRDWKGE